MGVLSSVGAVPGGKPFETSGKDSILLRRRKHGTTGRLALPHQHRQKGEIAETVRSAPGRDPRMARFIRILAGIARESGPKLTPSDHPAGNRRRLDIAARSGDLRRNLTDLRRSGAAMTAAFTFPGQGSQAVGMGKALADAFPAARAVFDEVDQ